MVRRVPGDKSISHRALMLAALGDGRSAVRGILRSADVRSTAAALRTLGVAIPSLDAEEIVIEGVGLRGLSVGEFSLDCGNSGTTTRLLAGIVAASPLTAHFTGDASLSGRPMGRVARPLGAMGARVELSGRGGLPMTIHGAKLDGLTWYPEVASAQIKSAILLAGLVGDVPVEVHEPAATRDHTERMLRARGVDVRTEGEVVSLLPRGRLFAADVEVPGDPSSAIFLCAQVAIGARARCTIAGVGVNPGRIGAFQVLKRMGAALRFEAMHDTGGEPMATIVVERGALRGVTITPEEVPGLIDELPMLACVAARAQGETRVTGAAELRVKESDRIRAVVENLRAIGVVAEELPDGFVVQGGEGPLAGRVTTHADHRVAMAFGVLGSLHGMDIQVDDPHCVEVSYPGFWEELARGE